MKLLFLHLSDIHLENKNTLSLKKLSKMSLALNNLEVDKVFLIISGDLTKSGKEEEYLEFKKMIGFLVDELKKNSKQKNIEMLIVPGNHDINYNDIPMDRDTLQKKVFVQNEYKEIQQKYIQMMANFYKYAEFNGCFISNKIIDIHEYNFSDFNLQINLINSAINSTFKDQNKDNDKGLHFLDENELELLNKTDRNGFVITVMHHSPEWYSENSKHKLLKYINDNTDILLCGHEHVNLESNNYINENKVTKICGGPLSPGNESIFNCILIDTIKEIFITYRYSWNDELGIYDEESKKYTNIKQNLKIDVEYYQKLLKDDQIQNIDDFRDFFIFPELLEYKEYEDEIISDFTKFIKKIENKKICIIEGNDNSGKTTFSKYLFLNFIKTKIPVIFSMKELDNRKINKIVELTFKEEYNHNYYNYGMFKQEKIENKIAIVDDADKINPKDYDSLVEELKKHFCVLILIKGQHAKFDLLQLTNKYIDNEDETIRLMLCDLYNEKRFELIKKVCKVLIKDKSTKVIEEKAKQINRLIRNQLKLINLNPSFIILFIKTAVNSGYEMGEGNIFNSIFVSNITNMLKSNSNLDVNVSILLLQKLSYYIHTHKLYPINQGVFVRIIEEYNEKGAGFRQYINPTKFVSELVNTRIISYTDNGKLVFTNNSYLAYFIAKECLKINNRIDFENIINNLCFGINSDILLFICFLHENSQNIVFDILLDKSHEFFDEFEELNFLKRNIKYILEDKQKLRLQSPTEDERKEILKDVDKQEKNIKKSQKINYIDIYDYDESTIKEPSKVFTKGVKFIEIISKILPDFIHGMEAEQIKKYIEAIYTYPNKLLYNAFKPIDDEIIRELSDKWTEKFDVAEYKELENTISNIQSMSRTILLNLYDMVARYASTKSTIIALNTVETNNKNYEIQKAMFYDHMSDTLKTGEILYNLYIKEKNQAIKNMLKRIYRKHLFFNNIKYYGDIQKHIDTFLPYINEKNKLPSNKKGILTRYRIPKNN